MCKVHRTEFVWLFFFLTSWPWTVTHLSTPEGMRKRTLQEAALWDMKSWAVVMLRLWMQLKLEHLRPFFFLHYRVRWPELQGGGCTCIGAQITWEKQRDAGHPDKASGQVIPWLAFIWLLACLLMLTFFLKHVMVLCHCCCDHTLLDML
jgi:hypothetical protein